MLAFLTTLFFFSAAVTKCASDADCQVDGQAVRVEFVGAAAKIKLYPIADSKSFIMVSQNKITEKDPQGYSVATEALGGTFNWDSPHQVQSATGTRSKQTYISKVLSNGAMFEMFAQVMMDNGVPANATIEAFKDQVKYSIQLHSWPFANPSNHLEWEVSIASKAGSGQMNHGDHQETLSMDTGVITMPTVATIDGVERNVTVNLAQAGGNTLLQYKMPSFTTSLWYDPTISAASFSVPSVLLIVALLAIFSMLA